MSGEIPPMDESQIVPYDSGEFDERLRRWLAGEPEEDADDPPAEEAEGGGAGVRPKRPTPGLTEGAAKAWPKSQPKKEERWETERRKELTGTAA